MAIHTIEDIRQYFVKKGFRGVFLDQEDDALMVGGRGINSSYLTRVQIHREKAVLHIGIRQIVKVFDKQRVDGLCKTVLKLNSKILVGNFDVDFDGKYPELSFHVVLPYSEQLDISTAFFEELYIKAVFTVDAVMNEISEALTDDLDADEVGTLVTLGPGGIGRLA